MKNLFSILLFSILLLGCETDPKLTFKMEQLENKNCADCPKIEINIPRAIGETRIAKKVNAVIDEKLIYDLKFEDSIPVNSPEQAMQSFTKSYQGFKNKFDDEAIGWEAQIDGEVSYKTSCLLSVILNTYTFTGGAHGYSATTFLNFDKEKNIELENYELFKDLEGFIVLAEKTFREATKIPKQETINATGFMFSDDVFHLPENIGFTEKGLQLIYNQYEVASFAEGPIKIHISFKEANKFLKEHYQIKQ